MSRRAAAGVLVTALVLASGCSGGSGGDAPEAGSVCGVVGAAQRELLEPSDLTFEAIVGQSERTVTNAGASAMLGLARSSGGRDLGPYEAVVAYLDARNVAWTAEFEDEVDVPERTDAVVASARRLDRDLADGLCAGEPEGGS